MTLVSSFLEVLQQVASVMPQPTFASFFILITGCVFARRRRRSAIEPKIGHLKNDHRVRRCCLSGLEGDAINIVLAAAGANLRKLLGRFYFALSCWMAPLLNPPRSIPGFNSIAA